MMKLFQNAPRIITRTCLSVTLVLCFSVSQVWADSNCMTYFETLQTSGPTPLGPLSGIATVTIGGETKVGQFFTIAMGPIQFAATGDIIADFADLYLFPDGLLTAISADTTSNIAEGTFTAKTRFTGGTGIYANVHGWANLNGTGEFLADGSTVTNSVTEGEICFGDDSDSDRDEDSDSDS